MTEEELLIDREEYLKRGVHIGTKSQHKDMEDFIFHVKKNQLAVINLEKTDQQIRKASEMLSNYEPEEIMLVGRKEEVIESIEKLSDALDTQRITGRFMPGTLTNPQSDDFAEPEIVLVTDPETDAQAIKEAKHTNLPVIAIADSENSLKNIDIAIPANNKGEKSVASVLYLMGREYSDLRGEELGLGLEDFAEVKEVEEE